MRYLFRTDWIEFEVSKTPVAKTDQNGVQKSDPVSKLPVWSVQLTTWTNEDEGSDVLVVSVAGFPSGNRTRIKLPLEALVMLVAFGERGLSAYSPLGSGTGALVLIVLAVGVLAYRLWPRRPLAGAPA